MRLRAYPMKNLVQVEERAFTPEERLVHITIYAISDYLIDRIDDIPYVNITNEIKNFEPLLEKVIQKAWVNEYFSNSEALIYISKNYQEHINWLTKNNSTFAVGVFLFYRCMAKNKIVHEDFIAMLPTIQIILEELRPRFEFLLKQLGTTETEFYQTNERYLERIVKNGLRKDNKKL